MKNIPVNKNSFYKITAGENSLKELQKALLLPPFRESKVFVLVDSNTIEHCFPLVEAMVKPLQKAELIEIPAGEENKDIEVCKAIWLSLSQLGADRNSLLINLGGGVVSDIGAFVASTYMRGIRYINVPTTLLSMIDAAIGGKTGIDLNARKNMIGTFYMPEGVFIYPAFLETLPQKHLHSGYAEMLKSALIADEQIWNQLKRNPFSKVSSWLPQIKKSIEIKRSVVDCDTYETGIRKVLNFGHTIGHAIESSSLLKSKKLILHGEAVAAGMICETYLSNKMAGLPDERLEEITGFILSEFPPIQLPGKIDELIHLMRSDKKNTNETFNFTLLADIGQVLINQRCPENMIIESLQYYKSLHN